MRALTPGDVVVVTRLDRLARSSRDLRNIVHDLQEAGCGFTSLAESWCDSTSPAGKLLVTILGGISEFERSLILARTEAGIAKARKQRKRFGRPSALDAGQRQKIAECYAAGETMAALAEEYEVGEATFWRALQPALAFLGRGSDTGKRKGLSAAGGQPRRDLGHHPELDRSQ
ncbi:recombinase family protein, partial [Bradyrhizobium sp. NAS80.1]|uniref:recombinase family protein n=1 Tax=Bradyrhizobium sp. NAS80.1 TaxID=1680159 RepID=UPI0009FCF9E6